MIHTDTPLAQEAVALPEFQPQVLTLGALKRLLADMPDDTDIIIHGCDRYLDGGEVDAIEYLDYPNTDTDGYKANNSLILYNAIERFYLAEENDPGFRVPRLGESALYDDEEQWLTHTSTCIWEACTVEERMANKPERYDEWRNSLED